MKNKIKLFDGHIHTCFRVPLRESVYIYDREFELLNINKFCFLAAPIYTRMCGGDVNLLDNLKALYYKATFAPDAYAFAGLEHDYSMPVNERADFYLKQIKEYMEAGFDGLKMLEGYPPYYKRLGVKFIDDCYAPLWDYLEQNSVPVLMHLAHPKIFWDINKIPQTWIDHGNYYDDTFPTFYDFIDDIFAVLDRHPNLRLTLAHTGFMGEDIDLAQKFLSYPYTCFDITPGGEQILEICNGKNRDWWIDFIKKNPTRFKHGTDLYQFEYTNEKDWQKSISTRTELVVNFLSSNKQFNYVGTDYKGIKLPKKMQKLILHDNLLKELGLPKPIDFNWCKNQIERFKPLFPNRETLDGYDLWCMEHDFESLKKEGYLTFFG